MLNARVKTNQFESLKSLAQNKGKEISVLVREAIDSYIASEALENKCLEEPSYQAFKDIAA